MGKFQSKRMNEHTVRVIVKPKNVMGKLFFDKDLSVLAREKRRNRGVYYKAVRRMMKAITLMNDSLCK